MPPRMQECKTDVAGQSSPSPLQMPMQPVMPEDIQAAGESCEEEDTQRVLVALTPLLKEYRHSQEELETRQRETQEAVNNLSRAWHETAKASQEQCGDIARLQTIQADFKKQVDVTNKRLDSHEEVLVALADAVTAIVSTFGKIHGDMSSLLEAQIFPEKRVNLAAEDLRKAQEAHATFSAAARPAIQADLPGRCQTVQRQIDAVVREADPPMTALAVQLRSLHQVSTGISPGAVASAASVDGGGARDPPAASSPRQSDSTSDPVPRSEPPSEAMEEMRKMIYELKAAQEEMRLHHKMEINRLETKHSVAMDRLETNHSVAIDHLETKYAVLETKQMELEINHGALVIDHGALTRTVKFLAEEFI